MTIMASQTVPPWKALRDLAGLSQREVGRRADIESGRMSLIERGLIPEPEEEARLRRVLMAALADAGLVK
jgi:transcriptional regulator with XRE-family HTH domain